MDLSMRSYMDYNYQQFLGGYYPAVIDLEVNLENRDLWRKLHVHTNEMIVNKPGRCMFPKLELKFNKLITNAKYDIYLEMVPVDNYRYKYTDGSGWAPSSKSEHIMPNKVYKHPESGNTGAYFMANKVSFNIKFTNTPASMAQDENKEARFLLVSMHKYVPRIIVMFSGNGGYGPVPRRIIQFEETEFVAVTAYQNDIINDIKTNNNKFARGFRPEGKGKSKRKQQPRTGNSISPCSSRDDSSISQDRSGGNSPADEETYSRSSTPPGVIMYQPVYQVPQVLPRVFAPIIVRQDEMPKTDFSIRAILGIS